MSEDRSSVEVSQEDDSTVELSRRRWLAAVGLGGAAAVAGCVGAAGDGNGNEDSVDPRFGYTGTSSDETPPVEPDHTVQLLLRPRESAPIPEFYFEPTGLLVEPGDTVRFDVNTPHHNVNAYHPEFGYTQRVPDGVPPFSSPILTAGTYWLYTFETAGVHDIVCAPHEIFGMAGRIVVGSATGPGAEPVGEAPGGEQARPPDLTAGLVLSDPAMAPDAIVENGQVAWADIDDESKRVLIQLPEGGH